MTISLSTPHGLVGNQTIQDIGFQGQLVNTFSGNHVFTQVNDASTAIDFGSFVAKSTTKTCKVPAADTDTLIGISVRQFKASTVLAGTVNYAQYDAVSIADQALDGIVCLAVENVTAGDFAVSITAGGGTVGGRSTTASTSTVAAKAGGNTGNGTCIKDGTTPLLTGYQDGVYTIICTVAATNNGTFRITDPKGSVLGDLVMSGGAGTFSNQIKFALADGATDFIVGDGFTFTVNAGRVTADGTSGKVKAKWLDTVSSGGLGRVEIQAL
jgi:hypothetical protein